LLIQTIAIIYYHGGGMDAAR